MPSQLDKTLHEALAFHEAFRRLGFEPEQLFLGMDSRQIWMELRAGEKTFVATCGSNHHDIEHVQARWAEKVKKWNSSTSFAERVWNDSFVRRNAMAFVLSVVSKDIELPCAEKQEAWKLLESAMASA